MPAGHQVLNDLSLAVEKGEYVLICGPSGSGKSTLGYVFNGLIPHFYAGMFQGDCEILGENTRDHGVHELFGKVGLVFQNPDTQLFCSTVEMEIVFALESLGLDREEIEKRLQWVVDTLGIEHLLPRSPDGLSGGEKKIVAIGSVLSVKPAVIVLDEPFANLDWENERRVAQILGRLHTGGMSIIVIEHRLHAFMQDMDRIVILKDGRIVENGPPGEVLAKDLEPYGVTPPEIVRFCKRKGLNAISFTISDGISRLRQLGIPWNHERGEPVDPDTGPREEVLDVRGLHFSLARRQVLKGVELEVWRGECVSIIGRNGSGKTTLIKHFNGLYRPESGTVKVLGRSTQSLTIRDLARQVGVAFQNSNDQFFRYSVRDEILVGPQVLGAYDEAWIERIIRLLSLQNLLERSPYRLSEGEKKRVAIASVLATRPDIIILDEPTVGQDRWFRQILGNVFQYLRAQDRTIILVTNDLEFAEEHSGRWLVLADGRIIADGTPNQVMSSSVVLARTGLRPTDRFQIMRGLQGPM
jgi:energy-coupling factor transport system ATP-binding protein